MKNQYFKSKILNLKTCPALPDGKRSFVCNFGHWNLEFICDLFFGICDFLPGFCCSSEVRSHASMQLCIFFVLWS
jgi:hypothetical protein